MADRLAFVTGHFCENFKLVAEVARNAKAVHDEPLNYAAYKLAVSDGQRT